MIGSRLAASRKAVRHIQTAMPDTDDASAQDMVRGMWDNLGRVLAEYPHLKKIATDRLSVVGEGYVRDTLAQADNGTGAVFYCIHMGNWEIPPTYLSACQGADVHLMYRAPNNPWVDKMLRFWRTRGGDMHAWSKSRAGGQGAMKALKQGGSIAILIDQKYNEGVNVPFFGHGAMTNPFFVKMARKYKVPLVPSTLRRTHGAHFELTVYPPMDYNGKSDDEVMAEAHAIIEGAIRKTPEQWLWLHRRWKDF